MPDYHCFPSTITFNFVLNLLVSLGVVVNTCSFNILIKGLCKNDNVKEGFELLDEFPKQDCQPNAITYSTLMHCLCRNGRTDEAFKLLDRMENEGCGPDTITFSLLISGLGKQGRADEGVELDRTKMNEFKQIRGHIKFSLMLSFAWIGIGRCQRDFRPVFLSNKTVIEGLCKDNRSGNVDFVLNQMMHQGFVPKMGDTLNWINRVRTMKD
ncbi:hypothetical protein MKX03_001169 [Papaver bracteatum]|nr:hypothetical protein MKX03_001169 [Papaver bracteatum]